MLKFAQPKDNKSLRIKNSYENAYPSTVVAYYYIPSLAIHCLQQRIPFSSFYLNNIEFTRLISKYDSENRSLQQCESWNINFRKPLITLTRYSHTFLLK